MFSGPGHYSYLPHLQEPRVATAAVVQGSSLGVAEARKLYLHAANCHRAGMTFIPMAIEALGGWSSSAFEVIGHISRLLAVYLGHPLSETCCHLFQKLSVALWRGNASMWATHRPSLPASVDGFI
uniref:Uncharacterized protein n=1 Tax=Amphimedon queenslandica TaxID=400682 RepID=A0A1X7U4A2_AMPQE